jgi:hypothetical protein
MKVSEIGSTYHVVVGDKPGRLVKLKHTIRLWTGTDDLEVFDDTEVREAMPREKATALLKRFATTGATADTLTLLEIGCVLNLSQRAIRMIIARGAPTVERVDGPEDIIDHDYMGAFDVTDELIVADPCYVGETNPLLACTTPALPGRWHAYIRHPQIQYDISLAIVVVHEDHPNAAYENGEELGMFGVDGGNAMIVDGRARANAASYKEYGGWTDGLIDGLGCYSSTANGDGLFPVRTVRVGERAVVVRASLAGPDEAYFRAPAPPKPPPTAKYTKAVEKAIAGAGTARDYSPKTKFAIGERVSHPKFGDGVVSSLLADGKVQIDFADGPRTLVHGR